MLSPNSVASGRPLLHSSQCPPRHTRTPSVGPAVHADWSAETASTESKLAFRPVQASVHGPPSFIDCHTPVASVAASRMSPSRYRRLKTPSGPLLSSQHCPPSEEMNIPMS